MPLIIITGYPSSGKTRRAVQLLVDLESRLVPITSSRVKDAGPKRKVVLIGSHHASLDPSTARQPSYVPPSQASNPRDQIYNLAANEKTARAEEFSAIKRALNKNDVVIADGLNYIKGFRYQLWCEAKASATRCVVVHVAAREDECEQWNRDRLQAWHWDQPSQELSDRHDEEMMVGGVRVRVGRNIIGALEPESHTAIYGDKAVDYDLVVGGGSRSRSSSMGAGLSDDDQEAAPDTWRPSGRRPKLNEDAMTLKSLYISDRDPESHGASTKPNEQHTNLLQNQPTTAVPVEHSIAPTDPPDPKSSLPYSASTLKSLLMRYEPPSPFTRWDTPLFTVPSADLHPPYEAIWSAIFPAPARRKSQNAPSQTPRTLPNRSFASPVALESSQTSTVRQPGYLENGASEKDAGQEQIPQESDIVKRHAATILPKATASEALQILESATSEVIKVLLRTSREAGTGTGDELTLHFPAVFSTAAVTRTAMTTPTSPLTQVTIEASPSTITHPHHKNHQNDNSGTEGNPDIEETTPITGITTTINPPLDTPLSQPMLQRLRRKYTQMQRGSIAHGQGYASSRLQVIRGFLTFLAAEWEE